MDGESVAGIAMPWAASGSLVVESLVGEDEVTAPSGFVAESRNEYRLVRMRSKTSCRLARNSGFGLMNTCLLAIVGALEICQNIYYYLFRDMKNIIKKKKTNRKYFR